jgi:hypothetical protein
VEKDYAKATGIELDLGRPGVAAHVDVLHLDARAGAKEELVALDPQQRRY